MGTNLASSLRNCRTWDELQRSWLGFGSKEKGDLFEELVKYYLLLAPEFVCKFKSVWLLKEVPSKVLKDLKLPLTDKGIDLLAETKEGDYWAVQCKYRDNSLEQITWREISTFMGLYLGRKQITFGLIASTTEKITKVLKDHEKLGFLAYDVWQSLNEEFFLRLKNKLHKKRELLKPRKPRAHQTKAVKKAYTYFLKDFKRRGKLIMPCGTGKSLTAFFIAEKLKAKTILISVPSLSLIRQTLKEWMRELVELKKEVAWICVCSDESAGAINQDDISTLPQDLGVPCFTDATKIKDWLIKNRNELTIVFTTYQSGKVLSAASRAAEISYDLAIFDEAHKTVGSKEKLFSFLLNDSNLSVKNRLFMTATEKHYKGDSDHILSMDDSKNYGETIHNLTFKKALESKPPILSDYKVVTIIVSQKEITEIIKNRAFISSSELNLETDAESLASLVALRKAIKQYPIKHAVSFHGSIKRAKDFCSYNSKFTSAFPKQPILESFHVSGQTPTGSRARILHEFSKANRALITNAKCLTEGVDVPNIDAILFADPRKSLVDIVQATGRALRPYSGKKLGYVIVPVVHSKNDTMEQLLKSDSFRGILVVLSALGSQDDRLIEYFRSVSELGARSSSGIVSIQTSTALSKEINIQKLVKTINLRIWNRLAKLSWRPFKEARSFVHNLSLRNVNEWGEYCSKSKDGKPRKPIDIPSNPSKVYLDSGWKGFSDWLGRNRTNKKSSYKSGQMGGTKKSEIKTLAARQNILLRWNPREPSGRIPVPALIDGGWYRGKGKNGKMAMWNSAKKAFLTIKKANLKNTNNSVFLISLEKHGSCSGGSFSPEEIISN